MSAHGRLALDCLVLFVMLDPKLSHTGLLALPELLEAVLHMLLRESGHFMDTLPAMLNHLINVGHDAVLLLSQVVATLRVGSQVTGGLRSLFDGICKAAGVGDGALHPGPGLDGLLVAMGWLAFGLDILTLFEATLLLRNIKFGVRDVILGRKFFGATLDVNSATLGFGDILHDLVRWRPMGFMMVFDVRTNRVAMWYFHAPLRSSKLPVHIMGVDGLEVFMTGAVEQLLGGLAVLGWLPQVSLEVREEVVGHPKN